MKPKTYIDNEFSGNFKDHLKSLGNNKSDICPPAGHLFRYFNNELSGKQQRRINDHLNFCPLCNSALESLKTTHDTKIEEKQFLENWDDNKNQLDEKFYSSLDSISITASETTTVPYGEKYFKLLRENWHIFSESFLAPRVLAYAGSVAIFLLIGLYSIAYFNRSDFYYLAEIKTEKQISLRTETVASSLTEGMNFFDKKNYKKATEKFKSFLKNNPDNYSVNFYMGLCYLGISKSGLPGLAYKYDRSEVKDGIKYLETALSFASENQFYQEDCYWYLGKAYLMIDDIEIAKMQFSKIEKLNKINLMRKNDAQKMLSKLK